MQFEPICIFGGAERGSFLYGLAGSPLGGGSPETTVLFVETVLSAL